MPGKNSGGNTATGADWTAQVRQHLHDPRFNLLQPQPTTDNPATEHVERWQDNRIGWSQGADDEGAIHYRYDDWGNRTEARHGDGSTTALHYDGLHQLRQVTRIDPQGQVQSKTSAHPIPRADPPHGVRAGQLCASAADRAPQRWANQPGRYFAGFGRQRRPTSARTRAAATRPGDAASSVERGSAAGLPAVHPATAGDAKPSARVAAAHQGHPSPHRR
ncbi:hypothetical protein [Acidovorax sp. Leaf78]|uniref:hypothetical protein n=1 Tax=Acidovorax sp. Leaf78 TaxID=1736237 RepID=UPI003510E593